MIFWTTARSWGNSMAAATLKPPADITGPALDEWNRVLKATKKAGHPLQPADLPTLLLYVQTWTTNQQCQQHIRQHGAVIKWPNGLPGPSPQYKIAAETGKQLIVLLKELGCTPASRQFDKAATSTEPSPLSF